MLIIYTYIKIQVPKIPVLILNEVYWSCWTLYLVTNDKRGRSALSLAQMFDLNYRTTWRMLHKIRHAMDERDSKYLLSDFIKMDDAYI